MQMKLFVPRYVKEALKSELVQKNKVIIGTHHKTGTVWMQSVFQAIAKKYNLRFEIQGRGNTPQEAFDIYINTHSDFDFSSINYRFKGMHIIRDPRDLIVSATHYHKQSVEPQLHIKRPEFGNITYQEKLNSYKSFDDQMLFEMEHSSAENILDIKNWDYSDDRFINIRYEDLIEDYQLIQFEEIFNHLGFRDWVIGWCLVMAYRNSLFSGGVDSGHVRSGKQRQWIDYFRPIHKTRFEALFGSVLEETGYNPDQDKDWSAL